MQKESFEKTAGNETEIVFVLDESGSMHSRVREAVDGFNEFISEQKDVPGEANLTLITFNDIPEVVLDRKPIGEINTIGEQDYNPSGCTALYDGMGLAFSGLEKLGDVPENVVIVVLTDGLENASSDYTLEEIKEKVKEKKKLGWDILFLSCDIDSFGDAQNIGIAQGQSMSFSEAAGGTQYAMRSVSEAVTRARTGQKATDDEDWGNVESK